MDRNDVKKSIGAKLRAYYGEPEPKDEVASKYNSYEEAKEAGDVSGMIAKKLDAKRAANRSVIALTNELYSTLSIKDIMSQRKRADKAVTEAKEFKDDLYKREIDKLVKSFGKIGGLSEDMLRGKAIEAFDANPSEAYKEAEKDYREAKKRKTALNNCVDRYALENKDIIEAERERKRREEVLESGILDELGV